MMFLRRKPYRNKKVTELTAREAFDAFVWGTIKLIISIILTVWLVIFILSAIVTNFAIDAILGGSATENNQINNYGSYEEYNDYEIKRYQNSY